MILAARTGGGDPLVRQLTMGRVAPLPRDFLAKSGQCSGNSLSGPRKGVFVLQVSREVFSAPLPRIAPVDRVQVLTGSRAPILPGCRRTKARLCVHPVRQKRSQTASQLALGDFQQLVHMREE